MASTGEREPRPAADDHRPRHPHYEHRLHVLAALSGAPFLALVLALLFGFRPQPAAALAWLAVALGAWWLVLRALRHQAAYPLRTVATLLESLREGDYLHRGRMDAPGDALGEVIREVNALRDTLHAQRIQVQETVALLAKVIETVDIAVLTFGPDYRLRLINATGRALLGLDASDDDAIKALEARSLGLDSLLTAQTRQVMTGEFAGAAGRWQVRHRTFREGGEVHHLLVVADLSRVLREEERSAWQKLIRVLGHEINNSLAPIQSISEALQGRLQREAELPAELAEDLVEGLSLIASRSEALERFVKGYTRLAKLPEPSLEPTSLRRLLARVAMLEGQDRIVLEGPELELPADPAQLEQLLINLVKNALEASATGRVAVRWWETDTGARIDVVDDGPGPPPSENLFVPFFTTKPGGSGIGLVLARRIAEAHGGHLDLVPAAGGGACARLWLPRSRAQPPDATASES